jgi:hypothetical protein
LEEEEEPNEEFGSHMVREKSYELVMQEIGVPPNKKNLDFLCLDFTDILP